MIYRTSTYYKIKRMTSTIKIIQGGQGAGKNIAICQILFDKAAEAKRTITIMTDTYDNLKDGAIADFKDHFDRIGWDWDSYYNKTDKDLKIKKSIIQFRYISDTKKQAGKSKRRDILYINEANKIGWEIASTYIGRTHEEIYIDYNPDFEFWAHTRVPELKDEKGKQKSSQIIVTYLDNEKIPQSEIDFIESRKGNKEWYRIYGLGQTGYYSERRIYDYEFIDEIPSDAKRIPSGMDFGVSPDPTTLVDIWLKDNNLYCDEVFCENNLLPEKLAGAERMSIVDKLDEIKRNKGLDIVADSAGKTEIDDIEKYKYNIRGVKKPVGTIVPSINQVRGYNLYITKRSINLKKGIESWFFKVDHNGKIIPEPDGHEPDGLAAIRYVIIDYTKGEFNVFW